MSSKYSSHRYNHYHHHHRYQTPKPVYFSHAPQQVEFGDITTRYIYVLFGLFAHLYIIFSSSIYFALEEEFQEYLGVSKEVVVNYFAFFSIILLLISLAFKWTAPIKVQEVLIVFFLWILLRNLIPKECIAGAECGDGTIFPHFNLLYSFLCVLVMLASFMMHARRYGVSVFFTIVAIGLMILTSVIPVSCNQLNNANINTNMLKFTLYSIVWFVNRRMRLTEQVLANQYVKSLRILYTHAYHTEGEQTDHLMTSFEESDDFSIPTVLFEKLEYLTRSIAHHRQQESKRKTTGRDSNNSSIGAGKMSREEVHQKTMFRAQLNNLTRIYRIHREYKANRWFGGFFSWKNRFYETEILNIFDLARTLWILNVCPVFLIFSFIEYLLILYQTKWNIDELRRLIQVVELMDSLYKQRTTTVASSSSTY